MADTNTQHREVAQAGNPTAGTDLEAEGPVGSDIASIPHTGYHPCGHKGLITKYVPWESSALNALEDKGPGVSQTTWWLKGKLICDKHWRRKDAKAQHSSSSSSSSRVIHRQPPSRILQDSPTGT